MTSRPTPDNPPPVRALRPAPGIERRELLSAALPLAALATLPAPLAADDEDPGGVRREILLRSASAWNGASYGAYPAGEVELTVSKITIPARGELKWHSHPMPAVAYLLSGEVRVEERGGKKHRFTAGQVIPETVATAHRGVIGDQPAVLLAFYAGVKGQALARLESAD